ncbi:MAG: DUF438 domain-containing protein [Candidatus Aminicenantes bacterium]|nr:DUF438 domain-containing protein [Candidatus Aminicenantes bacterium]NIM81751.1 DUF438 domain-containing protein [Candidatus Aminicenantes bacterium]NIN21123.1 DUF438 domain-containing protein [Candidatus Aminicenantes bacterium]NIN44945.1 DUF438 domain-containing protein [Candidatus Aminicenantes bacterium]NIN87759.1 DUF438 domain-containing protein [Candidatus Aminicenantes bacterium]
MELNAKVKIDAILKTYPFLLEFMVDQWPAFKKLKNPVLRKTIGKMATMGQAAAMAGVDVGVLLNDIAYKIEKQTGNRPTVTTGEPDTPEAFIDKEAREEVLKDIIRDLHAGKDLEELKQRFRKLIEDVAPHEIANMEQRLIEEGMPAEEVKELCDVHVQIFQESLKKHEIPGAPPGHPIHTYMKENRRTEEIIRELEDMMEKKQDNVQVASKLDELSHINFHYLRKENQLFPLLEKKNVSGPSTVMWGIHDDIRETFKKLESILTDSPEAGILEKELTNLVTLIRDMIYKEERILFPMALEVLSEEEWGRVKQGEEEIGFSWVQPDKGWEPKTGVENRGKKEAAQAGLNLDTGTLTREQVNLLINHLPIEVSFVDENDEVRFYSHSGGKRIFPRSPGVIGRNVQNCHPRKSLEAVEKILAEFRAGRRDTAEFWIQMSGQFILIRYFALRDDNGTYKGTLEVTQEITDIRKLEGEKRLLDWE